MSGLFENDRNYLLGDAELEIIADRDKLAQWRHKGFGPAYYKLGRKIIYRGCDLNAWVEAQKIDPGKMSAL
ncbi:MAG: MerR family transcriptional regulator [Alphaproteobacteria bacterium]|nr:MerR family transcriptional regulator [Alphaproteobacteria bacterium]